MFLTPVLKPWAVKTQGDFKVAAVTGNVTTVTGGATHDIVAFRWASLTVDCIVWYVKWYFNVATGFTAGQYVQHSLYRAGAWSVAPSGATSLLPAVGQQMKKMEMKDSVLTNFQIAAAAEITTPGTRTLDALPVQQRLLWCPTTTIVNQTEPMLGPDGYLFYFHANTAASAQGFVIQNDVTMGAAGVINLHLEVAWSEVAPDSLFVADANSSGALYAGQ